MATFDIIVPAYNGAKFLSLALESVIRQTYPDWRIILVDDGSSDETPEIGMVFQQRLGPKMLFLRQQNGGVSAARNKAIGLSTAPYLALLDSDDVWLPDRLLRASECFCDPQIGLSYGLVTLIDSEGIVTNRNPESGRVDGSAAVALYTRHVSFPCSTVSFRRECIEVAGMFDESMQASEDRDLWLRIAMKYQVARIPEIVAEYRISPGSATSDIDRMSTAQLRFIEKYRSYPEFTAAHYRHARSSVYRQRAETLDQRGRSLDAMTCIFRALALDPFRGSNLKTALSVIAHLPASIRKASSSRSKQPKTN